MKTKVNNPEATTGKSGANKSKNGGTVAAPAVDPKTPAATEATPAATAPVAAVDSQTPAENNKKLPQVYGNEGPDVTLEIVPLSMITRDKGTQIREKLDKNWIAEITSFLKETPDGFNQIAPIELMRSNDGTLYLTDGFHRYAAHELAKFDVIRARVRAGNLREAILLAVGANSLHGLKRSNGDKRAAVRTLLQDEEWSQKPATWIAEKAGVSSMFVGNLREELGFDKPEGYTDASGRHYEKGSGAGRKPESGVDGDGETETGADNLPRVTSVEDRYKRTIPEKARAAFGVAQTLQNVLDGLKAARTIFKSTIEAVKVSGNHSVDAMLDKAGEFNDRLTSASNLLLNEMAPFAVCPYCKGNDDNCPGCEGNGYLTRKAYFAAPEELQKTNKTAAEIGHWERVAEEEETARIEAERKEKERADKEAAKKAKETAATKPAPKPSASGSTGKRTKKADKEYNAAALDMAPKTPAPDGATSEFGDVVSQITDDGGTPVGAAPEDLPVGVTAEDVQQVDANSLDF